jgi:hypothetical protein
LRNVNATDLAGDNVNATGGWLRCVDVVASTGMGRQDKEDNLLFSAEFDEFESTV